MNIFGRGFTVQPINDGGYVVSYALADNSRFGMDAHAFTTAADLVEWLRDNYHRFVAEKESKPEA